MRNPETKPGSVRGAAALALVAAVGTALAITTQAEAGAKAEVELKIATVAPEGSSWMKTMRDIDAEVRKATGDAVGFKVYPGGVQGDEIVVLRKIRSGQLHGGGFTGLGLGQIAPATRVMEVPFLFDNYAQIDKAYECVGSSLEKHLQEGGFTLLGWAEVGFVYLFSKDPIATQADLKKAKMWLWEGDPLAESFYRHMGVVPVPLPVTDVMTSLQTRLIDAVYASPYACVALQWFTRVGSFTDVPITFASGAVVVSSEAFNRIPAAQREPVLRICRTRFRQLVEKSRTQNDEGLVEIEKSGVKRVAVTAAELQRFREVGKAVWEEQKGKLYPPALLDAVQRRDCAGSGSSSSR